MRGVEIQKSRLQYWLAKFRIPFTLSIIQGMFLVYLCLKEKGALFLPMLATLMLIMWTGWGFAEFLGGNRNLVVWIAVLFSIGAVMQVMLMEGGGKELFRLQKKFIVAFVLALSGSFLFYKMSFYKSEKAIVTMLGGSAFIFAIMFSFGGGTGDGALIHLKIGSSTFQILELLKILYLFVMAGLLGKVKTPNRKIFGFSRKKASLMVTIFYIGFLTLLGELGTALLLAATGAGMMLLCVDWESILGAALKMRNAMSAAAAVIVPLGMDGRLPVLGPVFMKVYRRFYYFLFPEKDAFGYGMQYLQIEKALAVGGPLGPKSTRYLFRLSEERSDLVFAKLVQSCGILIGLFVIGACLMALREGYHIAQNAVDSYYGMLAAGITLLMAVQELVHIGYNVRLFPITGIPLPFISHGGVNLSVSMILTGILLVISSGRMEGRWINET